MVTEEGITIERVFNAPVEKVWEAWTRPEMVKKWWGPEHFIAPVVKIDFRVGGKYLYAMHGPAGTEFDRDLYSAGVFKEIEPPTAGKAKLVVTDYFSDSEGNKTVPTEHGLSTDMPAEMNVTILFEEIDQQKTKLSIVYPSPESEAAFEAMKKSGMEEGWSTSLDKLAKAVEG